jgi:hypothetical protein
LALKNKVLDYQLVIYKMRYRLARSPHSALRQSNEFYTPLSFVNGVRFRL